MAVKGYIISLNWAGKPLRTLETMLNFLGGTTTSTGLTMRAALLEETFETGKPFRMTR